MYNNTKDVHAINLHVSNSVVINGRRLNAFLLDRLLANVNTPVDSGNQLNVNVMARIGQLERENETRKSEIGVLTGLVNTQSSLVQRIIDNLNHVFVELVRRLKNIENFVTNTELYIRPGKLKSGDTNTYTAVINTFAYPADTIVDVSLPYYPQTNCINIR
jgi:hypothetical protein